MAAFQLRNVFRSRRVWLPLLGCFAIWQGGEGQGWAQTAPLPRYESLGFQTPSLSAQKPPRVVASHEIVRLRLVIERPVVREEVVTETEYRSREVVQNKPTWVTETRYREVERQIPVTRERILQQPFSEEKPVIETAYEERTVTETVMREVIENETRQEVVRKPVVRTGYRDETVLVEKPVERTVYQPENVTSYRPVLQSQTVYAPTMVPYPSTATNQSARPSLEWRQPGYVMDPATGQQVWQRRGLHWVRPEVSPTTTAAWIPAYVPQQQTTTAYVPEVTQQLKPVTVRENVQTYETRRVPFEQQVLEETVETRQVPVTRMKPVIESRVEKVPVERLRYETRTGIREIPIQETVYETKHETEPYTVQVQKTVTETTTEQVPVQVNRIVARTETEELVREILVRVPLTADDQRTVDLPSTLRVRWNDDALRIPANDAIVDYELIRHLIRQTEAAGSGDASVTPQPKLTEETSGQSVTAQRIGGEFTAVPTRPDQVADAGQATPAGENRKAAAGETEGGMFQRGIPPEGAGSPAADQRPSLGPSDGTF